MTERNLRYFEGPEEDFDAPLDQIPADATFGYYTEIGEIMDGQLCEMDYGQFRTKVPKSQEIHCYGVVYRRLELPAGYPRDAIEVLSKTPYYKSHQDNSWLSCCDDFMVYIGRWEPRDFTANATDGDGKTLLDEMSNGRFGCIWTDEVDPNGKEWPIREWCYVFRCRACDKKKCTVDVG